MNKGIEILLARMESNPDEFVTGNQSGKWLHLIEQFEDNMEPEERKALFTKLNELRMGKFTERVMKELLAEQGDRKAEIGMYAQQVRSKLQNMAAQQNAAAQSQLYNAAQNQAGSLTGLGLLGSVTVPASAYEHSTMSIQGSNQTATHLQLGKQTLTERTLKKLKALVK